MLKKLWTVAKQVFSDWSKHETPRMGAALAFYTILSLSPLLLLVVGLAGIFFSRSGVLQHLTAEAHSMLGSAGDQILSQTLASTQKSSGHGWTASITSFIVLLVSASGVFGELRSALNKIWDVQPDAKGGIWAMVRERIFSFGMVLSVGFLLIASLVASAFLAAASGFLGSLLPIPEFAGVIIDLVVSLVGISAVFALTFKYVPAAQVPWRKALTGGVLTAILFTVGKYALSIYLAKAAVGSAYGAAGSVVVVIVWIYYTAQIVFFGAEFTHVIEGNATAGEPNTVAGDGRQRPFVVGSTPPEHFRRSE